MIPRHNVPSRRATIVLVALLSCFAAQAFVVQQGFGLAPRRISSMNIDRYQRDGTERKITKGLDADDWSSESPVNNTNSSKRISKTKQELGFGKTPASTSKGKDKQREGDATEEPSQTRSLWYADMQPSTPDTALSESDPVSGSAVVGENPASASEKKVDLELNALNDQNPVVESKVATEVEVPQDQAATVSLTEAVPESSLTDFSENSASHAEQEGPALDREMSVLSSAESTVAAENDRAQDPSTEVAPVNVVYEASPDALSAAPATAPKTEGAAGELELEKMNSSPYTDSGSSVAKEEPDMAQYMEFLEAKTMALDDKLAALSDAVEVAERDSRPKQANQSNEFALNNSTSPTSTSRLSVDLHGTAVFDKAFIGKQATSSLASNSQETSLTGKKSIPRTDLPVDTHVKFTSGETFSSGSPKHTTISRPPQASRLTNDRQKVSTTRTETTSVAFAPDSSDAYRPGSPHPASKLNPVRSLPVDSRGTFTSGDAFVSGSPPRTASTSAQASRIARVRQESPEAASLNSADPPLPVSQSTPKFNVEQATQSRSTTINSQQQVGDSFRKVPFAAETPGVIRPASQQPASNLTQEYVEALEAKMKVLDDKLAAVRQMSDSLEPATESWTRTSRDTEVAATTETNTTQSTVAGMIQKSDAAKKKAERSLPLDLFVDTPDRFLSSDVFSSGSTKPTITKRPPQTSSLASDRTTASFTFGPDRSDVFLPRSPHPDVYLPGSPHHASKQKTVRALPVDTPGTFSSGDAFIRGSPTGTDNTSRTVVQKASSVARGRQEETPKSASLNSPDMRPEPPLPPSESTPKSYVEQATQSRSTTSNSQQPQAARPKDDSFRKAPFAAEKPDVLLPGSPPPASDSTQEDVEAFEAKMKVLDDKLATVRQRSDSLDPATESSASLSSKSKSLKVEEGESQESSFPGPLEVPESSVPASESSPQNGDTLESKVNVLVEKIAAMRQKHDTAINNQQKQAGQPEGGGFIRTKAYPSISLPVDRPDIFGPGLSQPAKGSTSRSSRQLATAHENDRQAGSVDALEAKLRILEDKLAGMQQMSHAVEEATGATRKLVGQPSSFEWESQAAYVEALEAKMDAIDDRLATMHQMSLAVEEAARATRKLAGPPSTLEREREAAYVEALEAKMDALDDKLAAMHQMSHVVEEATRATRKRVGQGQPNRLEREHEAAYVEALEAKMGALDDRLAAIHQMSHAIDEATRAMKMQAGQPTGIVGERQVASKNIEDLEAKMIAIDDKLAAIHQMEVAVEESSRSTRLRERQVATQYTDALVAKMNALDDKLAALHQMSFAVEEASRSQEASFTDNKASLAKSLVKSLTVDTPGTFSSGNAFVNGPPPPHPSTSRLSSRAFQQAVDSAMDRRQGAGDDSNTWPSTRKPGVSGSQLDSTRERGTTTNRPGLFRSLSVDTPGVFNERPDWKK